MSSRPNTIPGVSSTYIAGSEPEPEILTYITEGEKEEIQYLKGLEKLLKDNNKLKKLMVCVNDKIDESNENINIILSNPAFQIWLVFH